MSFNGYPPYPTSPYPPGQAPHPPPGQAPGPYGQPQQYPQQYPPQQGYGAPPVPPVGSSPYPPHLQQPYGYGPPPPQPIQGYSQNYGGPIPSGYPSPGYAIDMPVAGDAPMEAEALRSAMKGFGTNEGTLIKVLAPADPLLMTRIRETYKRYFNRDLQQDIIKETSGRFEDVLVALVRGPLQNDVHNIRSALKGAGTNETVLDDALLGRSNADMHAIQREYQRTFNRNLLDDVRGDLSFKTEVLYEMVLSAQRDEESPHINPQLVDQDANQLHQAIKGKLDKTGNGNKQQSVCHIMTKRSDGHLRAVAHHYERTYHKSLEEAIKKEFTGHMEHALLHILRGATDRAMRDAVLLEDCMRGLGTRDDLLVQRVVRVHWDRDHMRQVRGAYKHRYNKELATRIAKETSGDYERALVACVSV